jgi:hypothetical protein
LEGALDTKGGQSEMLPRSLRAILTIVPAVLAIGVPAVQAQGERSVGPTPPRLSYVDGEVSYWRPGAEDWALAQVNTALAAGDSIYAGNGANAELEIASRAFVRVGSGTELSVESLETGYLQLRLPLGHAAVDLRRIPEGQQIEVDTPNAAFLIDDAGYYRFDVEDDSTRFYTSRGGQARVIPAGGEELDVSADEQVVLTGAETASVQRVASVSTDAWDRWNYDRTAQLVEAPVSARYVDDDVAGIDDLDRHGDWRPTPKYGNVWVPRGVSADWAPYSDGRWVWDGYYGWTWVDEAPWGWAPYHYGRWCWVDDSYWGWAPGPIVHRPVYSPALVAFFGGPHVGVSVSIGTPFVSWVALGWGEPVVPWWGPRGFVGRPYWGGWGGPRYVNNTIIDNRTIINVTNINRYDNFRNRRAVIGIDGDRFGRSRGRDFLRVDAERARNLRPVRGELGIRPTRASLTPRDGRGQRPPDRIRDRRVVATRAPQDPARLPRSAGIIRDDARREARSPRLVSTRSDRGRVRDEAGRLRDERGRPLPRGLEQAERGRRNADDVRQGRETRGTEQLDRRRPGDERGRGAASPTRDARGRDVRERTRDGAAPPSQMERGNARERGQGRDSAAVERSRTAPQPPRGFRERDRNGREIRESGRAPAAPRDQRGRGGEQRERSEVRIPDGRDDRGREQRIQRQQQRAPEPPRQDRRQREQRSRESSIDRRSFEREQPRQQRIEQPRMQRQEQPRRERQPRVERQQRMEQPRVERQQRIEQPRPQRMEQPRPQRREQPRVERQAQPRMERQPQQQRMQRQEAPRQERQPRGGNERGGGGGERGGGGRDRER